MEQNKDNMIDSKSK